MIGWTTIEDALWAWVQAGTGLAASQIIWSAQTGPRPNGQYLAMRLGPVKRIGQDWLDVVDATSPATGAEIDHRARGQRSATLSLQCFAGPATGINGAVQTLDLLVSKSRLPTLHDALVAAGVGVLSVGPVQDSGGIVGSSTFEPRAMLDVHLLIASEVSESGTYIETVEVTDLLTDTVTEIPG